MSHENFPQIRPVTMEDRELAAAFFDQMGGETRAFFDRGGGNRNGMMRCFDTPDPTRRYFIAAEKSADGSEKVAGLVFLWDLNTKTPWLGIAVAEDWKGRHLGRVLLDYAREYCQKRGKCGIFLTTHIANLRGQGLYTRCGYQHIGTAKSGELLYFHPFPDTVPEEDGTI